MKNWFISLLMFLIPLFGIGQSCLSFRLSDVEAKPGDTVAVEVTATGFNQILALQYSTTWDPEELEFLRVDNFNLPSLSAVNFSNSPETSGAGKMGLSWTDISSLEGQTVLDGSPLYRIVFLVNQIKGGRAQISFSEQPTPSEVVYANENYGKVPSMIGAAVNLRVDNQAFNPLQIMGGCVSSADCSGNPGMISINAQGGTSPYAYEWSGPASYTSNEQSPANVVPGVYQLRVVDSEGAEAFARFNVQNVGAALEVNIITVCDADSLGNVLLRAGAFGQASSSFDFVWSTGVSESSTGSSEILVPSSGLYNLTVTDDRGCFYVSESISPAAACADQVSNLILSVPSLTVNPSDTLIFPVQISGFSDITALGFSLQWDNPLLQILDVTLRNEVADATLNQEPQGLSFQWQGNTGQSLSDGSALLELVVVVPAGQKTTSFQFVNNPVLLTATKTGQMNVPVLSSNGQISLDIPFKVELSIANAVVAKGESICIPISVSNFEDIVGAQFQLRWDTMAFDYLGVQGFGISQITEANFGTTQTDSQGRLTFSWVDNALEGQTLAPNSTLFELCLQAKGPEDTLSLQIDTSLVAVEFVGKTLGLLPFTIKDGVILVSQQVWPGDTDINGVVNGFDLLNIGLGFRSTGPARVEASSDWEGQLASAWDKETSQGEVNYKHVDANGDGRIDSLDVEVLNLNWGRTFATDNSPGFGWSPRSSDGTSLYLGIDTIYPGANLEIPIYFGTEAEPAQEVYGLAFTIVYDPAILVAGSVSLDLNDSWLRGMGDGLISVVQQDAARGKIHVAISRIDQQNISGFGVIARSAVTIEDVIFGVRGDEDVIFEIEDVRVIDAQESTLPVSPESSTAIIDVATSTLNYLSEQLIKVYPNPVGDLLQLEIPVDLRLQQIQLKDYTGRILQVWGDEQQRLSVQNLRPGWYHLEIITEEGIIIKRIVKQ